MIANSHAKMLRDKLIKDSCSLITQIDFIHGLKDYADTEILKLSSQARWARYLIDLKKLTELPVQTIDKGGTCFKWIESNNDLVLLRFSQEVKSALKFLFPTTI